MGRRILKKVRSVGNILFRLPKRKPNRAAVHTIKMAKRLVTLLKSKCLLRSSISYKESSGFLFSGWPPRETWDARLTVHSKIAFGNFQQLLEVSYILKFVWATTNRIFQKIQVHRKKPSSLHLFLKTHVHKNPRPPRAAVC